MDAEPICLVTDNCRWFCRGLLIVSLLGKGLKSIVEQETSLRSVLHGELDAWFWEEKNILKQDGGIKREVCIGSCRSFAIVRLCTNFNT